MDHAWWESSRGPKGPAGWRRWAMLTALVALAAVALAACGGGGSSSSSNSTSEESSGSGESKEAETASSSNDAGVEEVNKLSEELQERPTSIGITQPVGKPIPEGKEIWWISCGVPACVTLGETFSEGAKELGWTTKVINTDGSPGQIKSAWEQAVTAKPDAVTSSGTDVSQISKQLGELEAEKIPVVQYAIPEKVPGVTAVIGDSEGEAASFGEPLSAEMNAAIGSPKEAATKPTPCWSRSRRSRSSAHRPMGSNGSIRKAAPNAASRSKACRSAPSARTCRKGSSPSSGPNRTSTTSRWRSTT